MPSEIQDSHYLSQWHMALFLIWNIPLKGKIKTKNRKWGWERLLNSTKACELLAVPLVTTSPSTIFLRLQLASPSMTTPCKSHAERRFSTRRCPLNHTYTRQCRKLFLDPRNDFYICYYGALIGWCFNVLIYLQLDGSKPRGIAIRFWFGDAKREVYEQDCPHAW